MVEENSEVAFTTHDPYGKNRFLVVATNLGQSLTDRQYLTVMTHFLVSCCSGLSEMEFEALGSQLEV